MPPRDPAELPYHRGPAPPAMWKLSKCLHSPHRSEGRLLRLAILRGLDFEPEGVRGNRSREHNPARQTPAAELLLWEGHAHGPDLEKKASPDRVPIAGCAFQPLSDTNPRPQPYPAGDRLQDSTCLQGRKLPSQ